VPGEPRPLADGEVLLEVMAAGVGNWDEFVRVGGWDVGAAPPMALGVEAAGTVAAVGDAVSDWAAGDAVMTHPVPLRDQGTCVTDGNGTAAAVSTVPGGAASAIGAVADGGRLATITFDPPAEQRGITVYNVYVRPDGRQLRDLAKRFGDGQLEIPVAASHHLADAARALAQATGGHAGGAVVLTP
jgi:NADPH:quinone reductase-like Zn-dependent oxidoreductase